MEHTGMTTTGKPRPMEQVVQTVQDYMKRVDPQSAEETNLTQQLAAIQERLRKCREEREKLDETALDFIRKVTQLPPKKPAVVIRPSDLDMTPEDLRETVSIELKKGLVREYVSWEGHPYVLHNWQKKPPESFSLLPLVDEAAWEGQTSEAKGALPKCLGGLRVAGPDGKRWVIDDSAPVVVKVLGNGEGTGGA
jgi:hypothetical protein